MKDMPQHIVQALCLSPKYQSPSLQRSYSHTNLYACCSDEAHALHGIFASIYVMQSSSPASTSATWFLGELTKFKSCAPRLCLIRSYHINDNTTSVLQNKGHFGIWTVTLNPKLVICHRMRIYTTWDKKLCIAHKSEIHTCCDISTSYQVCSYIIGPKNVHIPICQSRIYKQVRHSTNCTMPNFLQWPIAG
jgi:hypothetical protein